MNQMGNAFFEVASHKLEAVANSHTFEIKSLPQVLAAVRGHGGDDLVVLRSKDLKRLMSRLELTGKIDDEDYFVRYPDVQKAVAEGRMESATFHFTKHGYYEGRRARFR